MFLLPSTLSKKSEKEPKISPLPQERKPEKTQGRTPERIGEKMWLKAWTVFLVYDYSYCNVPSLT